jgi:hypothetical protein
MPYAVLISAFGALVATAIAMFGLHSWTALKIAPFAGALLGAGFSLVLLRLHGLPLRASVEEYRDAAGVQSLKEISRLYLNIALGAALVVSAVEVAALLIDPVAVLFGWSVGWVAVIGYTFWRAWQINHPASFGRFDIIQVSAGATFLMISGLFLYGPFDGSVMLDRGASGFRLIKSIVVMNLWVALTATMIALFGVNILRRLSRAAGFQ